MTAAAEKKSPAPKKTIAPAAEKAAVQAVADGAQAGGAAWGTTSVNTHADMQEKEPVKAPTKTRAKARAKSSQAASQATPQTSPQTATQNTLTPAVKKPTPAQQAMKKLGLVRDIDLALHLPLRYEDETRITPLKNARDGEVAQIEATVISAEVTLQPRRLLRVVVDDGTGRCTLTFFTFFASWKKTFAPGERLRLRGEVKGGFWGRQMLHPAHRRADAPLPSVLTPIYPTAAQLPQAYLRRAIVTALARLRLPETIPAAVLATHPLPPPLSVDLPTLAQALHTLHHPAQDTSIAALQERSHPAWQRLKLEELLAQQLSQYTARQQRQRQTAPVLRLPSAGVGADAAVTAAELAEPRPQTAFAPLGFKRQTDGKSDEPAAISPQPIEKAVNEVSGVFPPNLPSDTPSLDASSAAHAVTAAELASSSIEIAARQAPARQALLLEQFLAALPFGLTAAQRRVCEEIAADLARSTPMHRLLQGDVGSGKTVVAAVAAVICIASGWQCALMAPTEILAEQHFAKLVGWLGSLLEPLGLQVAWLAGAQKKRERAQMLDIIQSGQAALVVGTHAVIEQQVQFARLGLAIIDEQHRFGVAQRLALRQKHAGDGHGVALEPHLLMMSATPIPRTLAMSYYADLDVSIIDELPPGRTPIVTKVIADARRDEVIERVAAQIALGRQAYWVCPLIEESEALDLSNATATYEELSEALPGVLVGLLHSRMSSAEKKAVMQMFSAGHMGLLVSTTVIEVGVDVPNASLMVIEHAERFGLSQLHQLRGRVGRGQAASVCVLLYSAGESGSVSENAKQRLRAMAETNDGFEIARRDLDIRGPGEFMGARQSGAAMLRFADLSTDEALLEWAREAAPVMLRQHKALALEHMDRWLGGRESFLKA